MLSAPPRVLVASPPPRTPLDAVPIHLGLARWPTERMLVTMIVKVTLTFEPADEGEVTRAILAADQMPPSLPVPSRLPGAGEEDLFYPGDFAPIRPAVLVAVTGHAHCPAPLSRIDARLAFAGYSRNFIAGAAAPSIAIPLTRAYARMDDAGAELPDAVPSDAVLDLAGLSPRAWNFRVELPGVVPRVRWVDRGETRERVFPMACDTLWLDTDAGKIVLVHRCTVSRSSLRDAYEGHLLVSLEREAAPRTLAELRGARVRGRLSHAVWAEEIAAGGPPPPSPEELRIARWSALDTAYEPLLPIAEYAVIAAELAEQRGPPGVVLDRRGLDEDTWLAEEKAWLTKMGEAALGGDGALVAEYGEHFVRAQDALAGLDEERVTAAEYAEIHEEIEASEDPGEVLRRSRMSLSAWLRLDRRWTAAAERDPEIAAEIERHRAAARARFGGDDGEDDAPA